jgi:hypothetical protein
MLDPRIYRTGFVVVALALVVLAFSLQNQPGPASTTLAPEAFNGSSAYATMQRMAADAPQRRPGSIGDDALATEVASDFRQDFRHENITVSTDTFNGRTVDGTRTLEDVTAVLPGMTSGSVVVIAHRDSLQSPSVADLSGTATLVELARDLQGETLNRTVVLASTTGSAGAAGAIRLASTVSGPIDAVIVLGDLAGSRVRRPVIVPWSDGQAVAPPMLRNTVAAGLGAQTGLGAGQTSFAGQFVHLAFPLTVSEQGPFGARGIPAVLLSLSGERGPSADDPVHGPAMITATGRAVLQTVTALDSGSVVAPPSSYLILDGKVVPGWAIALFVFALIVPVLLATVDGTARALRRGSALWRWIVWVLACALPFAVGVLVVLAARRLGAIAAAPPGPVRAGAVPLHRAGIAVLALAAVAIIASFVALRPLAIRLVAGRPAARRLGRFPDAGAAAAVLLVMCLVTIAIWFVNPFAAALLVPALHLWLWVVTPDVALSAPLVIVLLLTGVAPVVLVVVYYAVTLGFGPLDAAWSAVLLLAGGDIGLLAALEWSVVLGCVVSVGLIALRSARQERPQPAAVTVRGPATYAGPGSLGGTKSALRR